RRKYYSNKSPRENQILAICAHVRRGDVTPEMTNRWTDASIVAKTLAELRTILNAHRVKYRICVLAQGDHADVAELEAPGLKYSSTRIRFGAYKKLLRPISLSWPKVVSAMLQR